MELSADASGYSGKQSLTAETLLRFRLGQKNSGRNSPSKRCDNHENRLCGIACEKCPRMTKGLCPNGEAGCVPRQNKMCQIASCAFAKGVGLCFEGAEFPCETTKKGPISYATVSIFLGRVNRRIL